MVMPWWREESGTGALSPKYALTLASAQNGIGYGQWTHIDGFSESVLWFIAETERE